MTTARVAILTWGDARAEIARAGVLQADVARALGLSKTVLSIHLNGESISTPTPEFAARLMDAIDQVKRERES